MEIIKELLYSKNFYIGIGPLVLFLLITFLSAYYRRKELGHEVIRISLSRKQKYINIGKGLLLLCIVLIPSIITQEVGVFLSSSISMIVVAVVITELMKLVSSFFRPLMIYDKGIRVGYDYLPYKDIKEIVYTGEIVEVYLMGPIFNKRKVHVLDGEQMRCVNTDLVNIVSARDDESLYQ